jgi:hypothetical protein
MSGHNDKIREVLWGCEPHEGFSHTPSALDLRPIRKCTNFEAWRDGLTVEDLFAIGKNGKPAESAINCVMCPARNGWETCMPSCYEHFRQWAEKSTGASERKTK